MLSDVCADVLMGLAQAMPARFTKRTDDYFYEDAGYSEGEPEALKKAIVDLKVVGNQCAGIMRLVVLMEAIRNYHDTGPKAATMDAKELAYHDEVERELRAAVKAVMDFTP